MRVKMSAWQLEQFLMHYSRPERNSRRNENASAALLPSVLLVSAVSASAHSSEVFPQSFP